MDDSKVFGRHGEELAASFLARNGYRILERNYRAASCELDIIAMDGHTLVFVEVKSRRGGEFGSPAESVTPHKQRQMGKAALMYIARHKKENTPCRFDVVGVTAQAGDKPTVEVIKDAFELTGGY